MSVPLDRLYSFLQQHCNHDVLIYRYLPHGSRNIADCLPLELSDHTPFVDRFEKMYTFFHDQELLDLDNFPVVGKPHNDVPVNPYRMLAKNFLNRYDKVIVVHSELNSSQVDWLKNNGAVPVYWWSHALLALDWYRYAELDLLLKSKPQQPAKDFLIYNRAWQGVREYRLKFSQLIVELDLVKHCKMTFNPVDGEHYTSHIFKNTAFQITRHDLEKQFEINNSCSTASADYNSLDYRDANIEVVLETLYDDTRWHLTEKTCRPLACGKPFILMATPGSLAYLRRYGFKTYAPYIDETYDDIQDPLERMQVVVDIIQKIAKLPPEEKSDLMTKLQLIADYNQKRFFDRDFFNQIVFEFQENFSKAAEEMKKHQEATYFKMMVKNMAQGMVLPASKEEIQMLIERLKTRVL